MEVFDLTVTTLVKEDIYYQDLQELLGKFIHKSMLLNKELRDLHKKSILKNYSFSSLYPTEVKSKVYKSGSVYVFRIRSLDQNFIKIFRECLREIKGGLFQAIATEIRTISKRIIQSLYTVTPAIVTVDNKPWMQSDDLDLFIERIGSNAEKKYKQFNGEEINSNNLIVNLEFMNKKPIVTNYKGVKLLGHKVKMEISNEVNSQKLAYTMLGAGCLEKSSSLGAGFCMARFI